MKYIIERHGGRSIDRWRVVLEEEDKEQATKRFEREVKKMRQGGVRFYEKVDLDQEPVLLEEKWAPKLRRRW